MALPVESDFDSYVRGSGPRLKRLAFLLTGDLDTAEDLLQSAYARVLPRWQKISVYEGPDAYMRRVMVSIRTSLWRRLRGREVLTGEPSDRCRRPGVHPGSDTGAPDPASDGTVADGRPCTGRRRGVEPAAVAAGDQGSRPGFGPWAGPADVRFRRPAGHDSHR